MDRCHDIDLEVSRVKFSVTGSTEVDRRLFASSDNFWKNEVRISSSIKKKGQS